MINIMLKPASGLCNMRCKYCFYNDETQKREIKSYGIMTEQVLRQVIEKTLDSKEKHYTLSFQGGEPTLAGLDFFKAAVHFVNTFKGQCCQVSYAIQTNGLLLNEEWCAFLAENQFLAGVSLDGAKEIHDENRVDLQGKGTFNRVMKSLLLLRKFQVETNILTVVTPGVSRHFRKIFSFFEANSLFYQQYIPCLDPLDETRGKRPWSLTPERYGEYLRTAFDCWYEKAMEGRKRYHRYFDNLLMIINGQLPEACGMGGVCGRQYAVESDGSVFPCDFYMLDGYLLGNLTKDTLKQIDDKRKDIKFIEQSAVHTQECRSCRWGFLCRGGCRRDRDYFEQGIGKNYYCESYQSFFAYAWPRLQSLYMKLTGRML